MIDRLNSRKGTSRMICSTCGNEFRIDQTKTPPFCSERCQLIDLGRWLDEEIGVPHEGGLDRQPDSQAADNGEID